MRRFCVLLLLSACASEPAPQAAPRAEAPRPPKDPCKEAARFRRSGFDKILNLDFKGARADFSRSLELDPGNTGALQQLQVIDAMESGNDQAGASAQNNGMTSQVTHSKCQEASASPPKPQSSSSPRGVADVDGQIGMSSAGKDSDKVTPSVVHATVRRVQPEMSRCYARALQRVPSLTGDLVVRFQIDASGHVQDPATENSTLANAPLEACISKIVSSLVFPKERGAQHAVSYPISFR